MNYRLEIRNIRRGRKEDGRDKFVYAELFRIPDDGIPELLISATLEYITDALMDRSRKLL